MPHFRSGARENAAVCNSTLRLLCCPIANVIPVEPELRGAFLSSADHRFKSMKLSARDQPDGTASWTRQYRYEGIVAMSQRIGSLQQKDRTWFHLFGDP